MEIGIFAEISLILILTLILSVIARLLKQPILIAYILTGVLIPVLFGPVSISQSSIDAFSQIGIALLLFIVGIKLDLRIIRRMGVVSLVAGLFQISLTAIATFMVLQLFAIPFVPAAFLSIALSFSSTVIVVKLLSDNEDIHKLYGRTALGILIVQDIVAVLALMLAVSLSPASQPDNITSSFIEWGVIVFLLYVFSVHILPRFTRLIARSQELLFMFTISWCFVVAALFNIIGIGLEIGALIAGLSLSTSPYHYEISARIKPLRDFFIIMFFVALGLHLSIGSVMQVLPLIAALTVVTMLSKILFTYIGVRLSGYSKKVALLAGLSLSQVSEFSFILLALGISLGYVAGSEMEIATAVGMLSIAASSYLIVHGRKIYSWVFKAREPRKRMHKGKGPDVVLFGYNRVGYDLLKSFDKMKLSCLVVDYDPEIVSMLKEKNIPVVYGDASDMDFISELNFSKTKMVVSTIPDARTNIFIARHIKKTLRKKKTIFIATAHKIDEAINLYSEGVDYVIMPHFLGGKHASNLILRYGVDLNKFISEKARHLDELTERKRLGHEHPTLDYRL